MAGERATENKRLRGWMIRALDKAYPMGIETNELVVALKPVFPDVIAGRVEPEAVYLEEKKYIEKIRAQVGGVELILLKITTHGRDLVERSIPADPGVSVPGGHE